MRHRAQIICDGQFRYVLVSDPRALPRLRVSAVGRILIGTGGATDLPLGIAGGARSSACFPHQSHGSDELVRIAGGLRPRRQRIQRTGRRLLRRLCLCERRHLTPPRPGRRRPGLRAARGCRSRWRRHHRSGGGSRPRGLGLGVERFGLDGQERLARRHHNRRQLTRNPRDGERRSRRQRQHRNRRHDHPNRPHLERRRPGLCLRRQRQLLSTGRRSLSRLASVQRPLRTG